ncbi:MAG: radical SAM family heme chaperone HemW [Candidatus Marinimicrobia bacterium]|nr:radical SAM family heme chaperone HemW [bacterium]MCG2715254.1 radical SAM family heme chaperone HemW [Candidatus Neomarinimicrobiota bacterium]
MKKFSLYIHFPFCIRKCHYCDFYSVILDPSAVDSWTTALLTEIDLYEARFGDSQIETIYIGGGSPNLIGSKKIRSIFESLNTSFRLPNVREFTVEINPGEVKPDFLKQLKDIGVNRISVGVQSFSNSELTTLGRIHQVEEVFATFKILNRIGFDHLTLDLIFGIPGQGPGSWERSLKQAVEMGVDHLSLYNLIYEEGTPFYELKGKKKIVPTASELEWRMYELAHRWLESQGFQHYEISNWAKPGCESIHNSSYWKESYYLGLGPAAHSYDGISRWWNIRSVDAYIKHLSEGKFPVEDREELNEYDREIEFLFLSLRTQGGLPIGKFENLFLIDFKRVIQKLAQRIGSDEYWIFVGDSFKLTPAGWFVCDSITNHILEIVEEVRNDHKKMF